MKIDIKKIVRKNIIELNPYSSARSEFSGQASILLDANENSFGSPLFENFNRYPDPLQISLKKRLAEIYNVSPGNICVGNGSDQLIDNIIRIFCRPGKDAVIICPPTFKMYEGAAGINDAKVKRISLDDNFQIHADSILAGVDDDVRVIFLCSPNNPTGNSMDRNEMEKIIKHFDGIVVVDEAYNHFSSQASLLGLIGDHNNLIVLQTLSKDWGMAGLRIGMAYADPEIIDWLTRVKMPYNVSSADQQLALKALNDAEERVATWRKEILAQREWLSEQLGQLKYVKKVYPSDANFVLVRFEDGQKVYDHLKAKGIIIRNQGSQPGLKNCLRITAGKPEENQKLISELKKFPQ